MSSEASVPAASLASTAPSVYKAYANTSGTHAPISATATVPGSGSRSATGFKAREMHSKQGPRPLHLNLGSVLVNGPQDEVDENANMDVDSPWGQDGVPTPMLGLPVSSGDGHELVEKEGRGQWKRKEKNAILKSNSPLFGSDSDTGTLISTLPMTSPPPLITTTIPTVTSKAKKRSSITYIPSTSTSSPYDSHFAFNSNTSYNHANRSLSIDIADDMYFNGAGGPSALGRSHSLGAAAAGRGRRGVGPRGGGGGGGGGGGRSIGLLSPHSPHLKDRAPVTLTEKHAELLQFIAQKESKCLELRSQLAVHEAELLQLKRKWERIVNRGVGRSLSPTPSSPSTPSPSVLSSSHSPSTSKSTHSSSALSNENSSPNTFPLSPLSSVLSPTTVPVLEGLKEGVVQGIQGVSRLTMMAVAAATATAAGLESMSIVQVNSPMTTTSSVISEKKRVAGGPPPLRLSSLTLANPSGSGSVYRHGQKESQSSTSTATSTGTVGTVFSVSSASSATSAASALRDSGRTEAGAGSISDSTVRQAQGDDTFEDFISPVQTQNRQMGAISSSLRSSPSSSGSTNTSGRDAMMMVQDTGATPTIRMSPNPEWERRMEERTAKAKARITLRPLQLAQGQLETSTRGNVGQRSDDLGDRGEDVEGDEEAEGDFDWEDGSLRNAHQLRSLSSPGRGLEQESRPGHAYPSTSSPKSPPPPLTVSPGLAPISSIPGLAMGMNMGRATPSAQQMSSWVGSMGRKLERFGWGESGAATRTEERERLSLSKTQKRASLLLSDMQQSIVAALTLPSSSPSPSSPSTLPPAPATNTFASNTFPAEAEGYTRGHEHLQVRPAAHRIPTTPANFTTQTQPKSHRPMSMADLGPRSLLDDDDDDEEVTVRKRLRAGGVMQPTKAVIDGARDDRIGRGNGNGKKDEEEDEWNW